MIYSHSGCIKLLRRLGFECKRPQNLLAQADKAEQAAFIEAYDKLLSGLDDDEVVYFADAVHPEYQPRLAHGWVKKGDKVALRRISGRWCINFRGTPNPENFHCSLVQDERIDAASTIALFEKLEATNSGKKRIYVLAGNTRPYHACMVRQSLERSERRVKLIFQPAYAPHLNAIERLWGVARSPTTSSTPTSPFSPRPSTISPRDDYPMNGGHGETPSRTISEIISHKDFRVLE